MKSSNTIKLSLAALLAISLSACGGGKGADSSIDRGGNISDNSTDDNSSGGGGGDDSGSGGGVAICNNATSDLDDNLNSFLANITLKLVFVENCTFAMGSDSQDESLYGQGIRFTNPKHNVTISKPYYLGIYEVTQEQWLSVNSTNPSANTGWSGDDMSKHPIESITRADALGFIQALNSAEPNIMINEEQYVYDLPSEAEWELAARGGTTTELYLCEDGNSDCNTLLGDYEWYNVNADLKHQIVGTKLPNPWGFYDMYGNVGEYVLDRGSYTSACKYLIDDITDPLCESLSNNTIVRGSGYGSGLKSFFSSYRQGGDLDYMLPYRGFRVALVAKSVRDNMTKWNQDSAIIQ